jgi:hypothetical protein
MEGMSDVDRLSRLTGAYTRAGGTASKVLIRRVFVGGVRSDLVSRQRAIYDGFSNATASFGDDQTVAADDPGEVVTRLGEIIASSGADALNLRVHLPGMSPETVREQIQVLGDTVVGPLKMTWPVP